MNKPITISIYKNKKFKITEPGVFKYTYKNKILDWFFKLLLRYKALSPWISNEEKIEVVHVNVDSLHELILKTLQSIRYIREVPSHVYLGPEKFEELIYESYNQGSNYINFTTELAVNKRIFDIPITVVPHFEGILVV